MDHPNQGGSDNQYVGSAEALRLLGVKRDTLYAYASRGLVRTLRGADARRSLYSRADIERLRARREARSGHGPVAAAALRWGEPVLDSSITEMGPGGPSYRGVRAVALVEEGASFETVAELLWRGERPAEPPRWPVAGLGLDPRRIGALLPRDARPLDALALAVPALGAQDEMRFDLAPEATFARARTLLRRLAACTAIPSRPAAAARAVGRRSVAEIAAAALGARPGRPAVAAVEASLILCADHELNASAFAARVAASAGADLYACVAAALATLSGPRHGGSCDRVESLVDETLRARPARGAAARVVRERMRRGELVPGFGHRLYPGGDPRTGPLLDLAARLAPRAPRVRAVLELVRGVADATGERPTIDPGLVAVADAIGMPPGAAVALFALGRAAGWVAHIVEQRESRDLLRPRARYVGRR